MKKIFKNLISVHLILTLCCCSCISALAVELAPLTVAEQAELSMALQGMELQKEHLDLNDTDFSQLQVGEPVQTYIYTDNMFEVSHVMYPILDGDKLIFWAIKNGHKFQLSTGLVDEVNDAIGCDDAFAIIYDKVGCYLYTNNTFTLLKVSANENDLRSVLTSTTAVDVQLETVSLSKNADLTYSPVMTRDPIYYACNVSYVSQNAPSNMCWAATIACIVNYCNDMSYTAVDVAQAYYESTNYNVYNNGISTSAAAVCLNSYGLNYTYAPTAPSTSDMLNNIRMGYPLYTSWDIMANGANTGRQHAACIYAVNYASGYAYVMDPENGFVCASAGTDGYSYISSDDAYTLVLARGACYEW